MRFETCELLGNIGALSKQNGLLGEPTGIDLELVE